MPAEEKDRGSLQEILKELLASTMPETAIAPSRQEAEAPPEEAPPGPQPSAEERTTGEGQVTPPLPAHDRESPPVEALPPMAQPTPPGSLTPRAPAQPRAQAQPRDQAAQALLDGMLEIRVAPPVSPAHLLHFEQALRTHDEVLWLGTWGRPKEGTTVHLKLKSPTVAAHLFEGAASVDQVEAVKGGKAWQLRVSLAPEVSEAHTPEAPPIVPLQPEAPRRPAPVEQASSPAHLEVPVEAPAGQVDLEISPIASLEALNRLERLLTALSPGCRVVNVLSLDGVSTVLITLEGIDRETLTSKLQEKITVIQLDATQTRLVAKLPEKW